jgi:hypothetical protein
MASYLLSECLETVFLNLMDYPSNYIEINISTKDLYSCTLVSRHWCKISTSFLYAYPFHHFRSNNSKMQYYKLIRTLLGCVPQFEIKQIKRTYKQASTFNYISFIRGLIFHKLMLQSEMIYVYKEIWLADYNPKLISDGLTIKIMNYLIKFICKNCNNLKILEFSFGMKNDDDIIKLLTFNDFNGKNKLSNLKELYYYNINSKSDDDNLYLTSSNNVCNLKSLYLLNGEIKSIKKAISLSQFISSQKNLQHFILSGTRFYMNLTFNTTNYFDILVNSLITQSETLQIMEFRHLVIKPISEQVLSSLNLLKNIRELKFYMCINFDNLYSWVKDLKKLEVFEITLDNIRISEIQLIQLIQSFPSFFNKLIINDDYDEKSDFNQLFQQIPIYLHSLTYLELPKIFSYELISIFKSCIKLIYISVILIIDGLQEDDLKILGESVPKTLKRFKFRRIKSTLLKKLLTYFLQAYTNNGGILKYLELEYCNSYENYINTSEQFNIQITEYHKW